MRDSALKPAPVTRDKLLFIEKSEKSSCATAL